MTSAASQPMAIAALRCGRHVLREDRDVDDAHPLAAADTQVRGDDSVIG